MPRNNECIITHKMECPHYVISGKTCVYCDLPERNKLKVDWYHWLYLNQKEFKLLSLERRGERVNCIVDYIMKYERKRV